MTTIDHGLAVMSPEFINHIMACKQCFAPSGRYCPDGHRHMIESDAQYVSEQASQDARRKALASLKVNRTPAELEAIHKRAVEIYEERKNKS